MDHPDRYTWQVSSSMPKDVVLSTEYVFQASDSTASLVPPFPPTLVEGSTQRSTQRRAPRPPNPFMLYPSGSPEPAEKELQEAIDRLMGAQVWHQTPPNEKLKADYREKTKQTPLEYKLKYPDYESTPIPPCPNCAKAKAEEGRPSDIGEADRVKYILQKYIAEHDPTHSHREKAKQAMAEIRLKYSAL